MLTMNVIRFGWTENMQKIIQAQTHSKSQDMQRDYYLNQKKALEINPRHPLIKELLRRVEDNPADASAKEMAIMMFNTAISSLSSSVVMSSEDINKALADHNYSVMEALSVEKNNVEEETKTSAADEEKKDDSEGTVEGKDKSKVDPRTPEKEAMKKKTNSWLGFCGHEGCEFSARSTSFTLDLAIEKVK
mgnify:CR=1 FL=1